MCEDISQLNGGPCKVEDSNLSLLSSLGGTDPCIQ